MVSSKQATGILNGVVGDYLDANDNELAVAMNLYHKKGELVSLDSIRNSSKIAILVHGLTDTEDKWSFDSNDDQGDYGSFLERDFGMAPLYLRYNTGLHVSTNGHKLNQLLRQTILSSEKVSEIVFCCHSMGGLVTRSALHYGFEEHSSWVRNVTRVVFLGTPHHGSPWEQLGNFVSNTLGSVPRPYMKLAETVTNLRSAGIKDLRYGYILDEDWQDDDENKDTSNNNNNKKKAHLVPWITYYTVTGTVTNNPNHLLSYCIGDALVRKPSAEGRSDNEDHHLDFPSELSREFAGVGHVQLAHHSDVYHQIQEWFSQPCHSQVSPPPPEGWEDDTTTMKSSEDEMEIEDTTPPLQDDPSTWAQRKGAASLVQDAVGNGVAAVEDVHRALTDETFHVISKVVPASSPVVDNVKLVHDVTVFGVYSIIQAVSYGTTGFAKHICETMEESEELQQL